MKKIIVIFFLLALGVSSVAQTYKVTSIVPNLTNAQARTRPRPTEDGQGLCALLIVNVGNESLSFSGNVGSVEYTANGYHVYVNPNVSKISYMVEGKQGYIDFDAAGIMLTEQTVYTVTLEKVAQRHVLFHISPVSSTLYINSREKVELDSSGTAEIDVDADANCSYLVTSDGYLTSAGSVVLSEEEQVTVVNIELEPELFDVPYVTNVDCSMITLIVDGKVCGPLPDNLKLPLGTHQIILRAEGYSDKSMSLSVGNLSSKVDFNLNKLQRSESGISEKLRNKTSLMLRGGVLFNTESNDYSFDIGSVLSKSYYLQFGIYEDLYRGRHYCTNIGLELGASKWESDTTAHFFTQLPITFNLNVPLGKLNRYSLGLGLGPIIGAEVCKKSESSTDYAWEILAGVRARFRFQFSKFLLEPQLSWAYHGHTKSGVVGAGISIGWMPGKKKKL